MTRHSGIGSRTMRPANVLVSIRRGETLLRWILAGLGIGLVAGAVFGMAVAAMSGGAGAFLFGALMGANFGVAVGAPFGIVLGIFNALLPSPSTIARLILTARIAGTILVIAAGIGLAAIADDAFVVAALLGVAAGWALTPTVVWSSVEPVAPSSGHGTARIPQGTPG